MKKVLKLITDLITSAENSPTPLIYFILTFFFAISLRTFLEIFWENALFADWEFYHFALSYVFIGLGISFVIFWATKEKIAKILRVVLPSFLILIITPLIDSIVSKGKGYHLAYFIPGLHQNLVIRFVKLFGGLVGEKGATPGVRMEIFLILIGVFGYIYLKTKAKFKSLIFTLLAYGLLYLYALVLFIIKAIQNGFGLDYMANNMLVSQFYLLLLMAELIYLFYLWNRQYFKALLKDFRTLRILHYLLMFILGSMIAQQVFGPISLTQEMIFAWPLTLISIILSTIFIAVSNNLFDLKSDTINHPDRPSISGVIPQSVYLKLAWFCLALALIYAWMINFTTLILITSFIACYCLYSIPPWRLKRITLLSKLPLAASSVVIVILGYYFISGQLNLPLRIIIYFLITLTLTMNFIDLKDFPGDLQEGIRTLPVRLGMKLSQFLIGLFFFIAYSSIYFILSPRKTFILIVGMIVGIIQFVLINRKQYQEKPVFIFYLMTMIALIFYLNFY